MNKYIYSGIVGAIALFFATIFIRPWFMPGPWVMVVAAGLIVLSGVFVGLLWWEREGEAKERMWILLPDRAAVLASTGVIIVAILLESALGEADPWLFVALGAAFIARAAGKWYRRAKTRANKEEKAE